MRCRCQHFRKRRIANDRRRRFCDHLNRGIGHVGCAIGEFASARRWTYSEWVDDVLSTNIELLRDVRRNAVKVRDRACRRVRRKRRPRC